MLAGQNDKCQIVDAREWNERRVQERHGEKPHTAIEGQYMPELRGKRLEE
jgi:hypothetical protein